MSELYDILFNGEIHPKATPEMVKANLSKVFKIPADKVEALFNAKPAVIKKGVDEETAKKYKMIMQKAGAIPVIQRHAAASTEAQPAPAKTEAAPSSSPPKKESLMERMARLEKEQEEKNRQREQSRKENDRNYDLSICVKGADVLRDHERTEIKPVEVDVSNITVDANPTTPLEPPRPEAPPAPDVSHIQVMEAGMDLSDHHDHDLPLPDIDVSSLDVAEQEGYIVEPKEFIEREIDLSHLGVADVGADMSEGVEKEAPPPPPDTSSIKLTE